MKAVGFRLQRGGAAAENRSEGFGKALFLCSTARMTSFSRRLISGSRSSHNRYFLFGFVLLL